MDKTDLYRGYYIAKNVKVGDSLPMDTGLCDAKGHPIHAPDVCELDESVQGLITTLQNVYQKLNTQEYRTQWQKYFSKNHIDIPVDVFFSCMSVLMGRKTHFASFFADEDRAESRNDKYIGHDSRKFHDVLKDREIMCGEYAAVAQMFFQSLGIDSEIFMGARLAPDKNGNPNDDPEAHTFLMIKTQNGRYVFDQMLDRNLGKKVFPVIRKVPLSDKEWKNFVSDIRLGGNPGVFPATDILNKHIQYYGAADVFLTHWSEKNIWKGTQENIGPQKTGLNAKLSQSAEAGKRSEKSALLKQSSLAQQQVQ